MRPVLCISIWLASALLATVSLPSMSAPAKKEAATATHKKKTSAPKFIPSSTQETSRERERRLLRECKGRPNAGACTGFTS